MSDTAESTPTPLVQRLRPELVFVVFGAVFGLILVFVTPPFQSPDEYNHTFRAYAISEGRLFAENRDGKLGAELPRAMEQAMTPFRRLMYKTEEKTSVKTIGEQLRIKIDTADREFVEFPNVALYAFIGYVPQAIGMSLARLSGSPIVMMYCGRFCNLLFWLALGYWALKLMPLARWACVAFLLMPMSIHLAASMNTDVTVNSITFLLVALVLRLTVDDSIAATRGHLALILACALCLILTKVVYSPLVLLVFLIPRSRFGGTRGRATAPAIIFGVCAVVFVLWTWHLMNAHVTPLREGVSVTGQLKFVATHPLQYLGLIADDLNRAYLFQLMSWVGILGWVDTPLPHFHFIGCLFLLPFLALVDDGGKPLSWRMRGVIAGTFAITYFTLITLTYANGVPPGQPLTGVQGRWYLPLTPLPLLLLNNNVIVCRRPGLPAVACVIGVGISLVLTVWVIASRYYVT